MKKYFLLFALISPLLFISCDVDGSEMSDDELIQAIIDSEKKFLISNSDLPNSAISSINFEMPNDFIDKATLAPELGYEIEMKSFDFIKLELDYERDDELYFTTKGRKLTSSKGKRKKGKGKVHVLNLNTHFHILCQMIQSSLEMIEKKYVQLLKAGMK
jgi:hypothetical protein